VKLKTNEEFLVPFANIQCIKLLPEKPKEPEKASKE
jgi:hypothetical protein